MPDKTRKIAIIGGGPAGVMAAFFASENPQNEVVVFDKNEALKTLLPTGGGRCNLAFDESDFKELAKNYPRGEKFLYSVLSRFSTKDTLDFFKKIGIKTYIQGDSRIFPVSDSSEEVRDALLNSLSRQKNIKLKNREKVLNVYRFEGKFAIRTDKNEYSFDSVIIASGGKGNGHVFAEDFGHNIINLKPALTSLKILERDFVSISGLSLKNISAQILGVKFENKKEKNINGDLLFTHYGISGPLAYKVSSYCAYKEFSRENPLKIVLNIVGRDFSEFDSYLKEEFNNQAKRDIFNVLSGFAPRNFVQILLEKEKIDPKTKAGQLKKEDRIKISKNLTGMVLNAIGVSAGEEIVTAGGVDLKEINAKTMESKIVKDLYFCGEMIDVDGLTGGFNLQNCWSTGFIAGISV